MAPFGLFVGLSTLDVEFRVEGYPQRNTKNAVLESGVFAGGPAANAAVVFAALGGRARLATALGRHALAAVVRDELAGLGVEVVDLAPDYLGRPAMASILVSDPGGDRTVASTAAVGLPDVVIREEVLEPRPAMLLTDGHLPAASLRAAQLARARGVPVVFDGGSWKPAHDGLLGLVDYAICSEHFLAPGVETPEGILRDLERRGVESRAVTCGERPIRWESSGGAGSLEVGPIEAVDTLGAGDFFHGGFAHALANGAEFRGALAAAARVATLSCRSFGTRAWLGELRAN